MRELKFEYGFQGVNGIVKKVYYLSEIPNIKEKCDVWNELPIIYVREFTGLKDKNLVDIYEGDLVNLLIPNEFQNTVFKIVYLLGGFSLESKDNSPTSIGFYFYGAVDNGFIKNWKECDGSLFKVIGNIHENKELI